MQNYGQQFGGQYQQQYPARQMWACIPVTCREEAVAVPMDYRYAGILMPDEAHNAVYAKIFDQNTGATRFFETQQFSGLVGLFRRLMVLDLMILI